MTGWWQDLKSAEQRIRSQCGEDGVIAAIFTRIGAQSRFLVDIGAGDFAEYSNTRPLLRAGWRGELFDCRPSGHARQERFTAENTCDILDKYNVPRQFDLLSLDIDGMDWYVLRALLEGGYSPRVIVAEFNCSREADPPLVVAYNADHVPDGTNFHGATLGAYRVLGERHGYLLVHQCGLLNCILIRKDCLPPDATAPGDLGFFRFDAEPGDPLLREWVPA